MGAVGGKISKEMDVVVNRLCPCYGEDQEIKLGKDRIVSKSPKSTGNYCQILKYH